MKIREFHLTNFGSLEEVDLDQLDDINVFVGPNGSGKSYLIQALSSFFTEFEPAGGSSALSGNDFIWHRRLTGVPICMRVTLTLDDEEITEMRSLADPVPSQDHDVLVVERHLIFGQGWKTEYMDWGNTRLVSGDAVDMDSDIEAALLTCPHKRYHTLC